MIVKQADAAAVSRNLRRFIIVVIFLPCIELEFAKVITASQAVVDQRREIVLLRDTVVLPVGVFGSGATQPSL
jgi:hypothetical protein